MCHFLPLICDILLSFRIVSSLFRHLVVSCRYYFCVCSVLCRLVVLLKRVAGLLVFQLGVSISEEI